MANELGAKNLNKTAQPSIAVAILGCILTLNFRVIESLGFKKALLDREAVSFRGKPLSLLLLNQVSLR
jgi:hypothetical protein